MGGLACTSRVLLAALLGGTLLVAAACGGGSGTEEQSGGARPDTTTTAPGHDSHQAMAPPTATVAQVAALGPGPSVGQTFDGSVGLNVCGRFLSMPAAVPADPSTGFALTSEGHFSVTPTAGAVAGHGATVAGLARMLGVEMSSSKVSFGAGSPEQIEVAGTTIEVAGHSFGPKATCGDTPAEVQLWVFPKAAVETGQGLVKVVEDPQDVPIVEDGMAFVIAVTPESSLPTLPPSALVR